MPAGQLGLLLLGRLKLNALLNKDDLGCVVITHPFHPFKGKKFRILKSKIFAGQEIFTLEAKDRGHFAVLREWTDKKKIDPYLDSKKKNELSFIHLLELSKLKNNLKKTLGVD